MALTKIGASLGGGADTISVTQNSHGLAVGRAVKLNSNGTYAYATADSEANADAVGIIIETTTNTMLIALSGKVTVDGAVPNQNPGTVLYLPTSAGLLTQTEPTGNNEVSKPMAVVSVANSEMILINYRGEVISTAGVAIADNAITNAKMADDSVGIAELSASGTADGTTFLRGDNTWAAAGGARTVAGTTDNGIVTFVNSGSTFTAESELKYNGAGNLYYSRAGTVQFDMVPTGGSSQAWALSSRTDGTFRITNDTDSSIDLQIDGDGVIAKARQPGFVIYLGSDSGTGQNGDVDVVPFNTTSGTNIPGRDQGGYFNTTSSNETINGITVSPYHFLAPVAGFYLLTCYIVFNGQGSGTDRAAVAFDVIPNGGSMVRYNSRHATSGLTTELRLPFSMIVYATANSQIRCSAGTYGAANQQGTRKEGSWFSGMLLG